MIIEWLFSERTAIMGLRIGLGGYKVPTDTYVRPEGVCLFKQGCQLCGAAPSQHLQEHHCPAEVEGSQGNTSPFAFPCPVARRPGAVSRQTWTSLCFSRQWSSAFLPAVLGRFRNVGRGKCFLQCVPSPGQPPPVPLGQSLAVNVASCPSLLPPLTHKQGSEQGQWRSRRWQDNARNNSSALISLSSGSQAKGAVADCCVSSQTCWHKLILRCCFFCLFLTFITMNVLNWWREWKSDNGKFREEGGLDKFCRSVFWDILLFYSSLWRRLKLIFL